MPPLQFIPTEDNPRLAIVSEIIRLVRDDMHPREALLALLGTLRRAYGQNCYVEISTSGLDGGKFRITRIWKEDGTDAVPNNSPWQITGVPLRAGGVIAEIVARKTAGVVREMKIDPADPVYPELAEYHSCAAVPGGYGDFENWVMVFRREPDALDVEYLENLVLRVGLIGTAMKNLQALGELRRANLFIDAEVDRIAAIQKSLLPETDPIVEGLDVSARSETFDRAGGDLYDYAHTPDGRWAFLIADASGHGPSAAVVAAMLNAIVHAYPARLTPGQPPPQCDEVLEYANAQLAQKRIEQSMVTAFIAIWDAKRRLFTYARAGHNPPMLRKANGEIIELNAVGDLPLAVLPETKYHHYDLPLQTGDVIVMYTDGITEAVNESNDQFGEDRLREALAAAKGTAKEILNTIWQAVQTHGQRVRPRDDQTIVVLRVT